MAALLAITPFFANFIYFKLDDLLILTYVSFILLIIFIREIIKDLEALKGDVLTGYPTLPVTIGVTKTKFLISGFALLGAVPAAAIFYVTEFSGISYYLLAGGLGVFVSVILLWNAHEKRAYFRLNNLYRFLIITGIFGLILFGA